MSPFLATILVIIGIIAFLLVIIIAIYYFVQYGRAYHRSGGVPYTGSFGKHLSLLQQTNIADYLNTQQQNNIHLLDLGCGDGKMLRAVHQPRNITHSRGVDINPAAIKRGQILNKRQGYNQITLIHDNFLDTAQSLPRAEINIVYVYLFPQVMKQVTELIATHATNHTLVIANTFPLQNHPAIKKITTKEESIHIYQISHPK